MGETEGLILLFCGWRVLIVGGWVVLAWSRKSDLGTAEIVSCVFLVLFKVYRKVVLLLFAHLLICANDYVEVVAICFGLKVFVTFLVCRSLKIRSISQNIIQ